VILNNILNNDQCGLKQTIDAFMTEKLKEFQQAVNTNVDQVIASRLSSFFNTESSEIENEVFTEEHPSHHSLEACLQYLNAALSGSYPHQPCHPSRRLELLRQIEAVKQAAGQKMFMLSPTPGTTLYTYVYKLCVINVMGSPCQPDHYYVFPHSLPLSVLLGVKLTKHSSYNNWHPFHTLITYSKEHPEYFHPNCAEFEGVCKGEKKATSLQREGLEELTRQTTERMAEAERIIKENEEHKNYYTSLEQRLQQLVIDEEKIKEEKQKMTLIKERLVGMRSDLDRERQEFEEEKKRFLEQKNKTIDLDACFDDLLR
jgi:hypothetical protein